MKQHCISSVLLVLLPVLGLAADEEKIKVVTGKGDVAHCLAPVQIRMIDGKLRQLPSLQPVKATFTQTDLEFSGRGMVF